MLKTIIILISFIVVNSGIAQIENEYLKEAKAKIENKDFTSAREILKVEAVIDSTDSEVFYLLAKSEQGLEQFDTAAVHYSKALNLLLEKATGFLELGTSEFEAHNYYPAIDEFGKVISLIPAVTEIYKSRGYCYYRLDDFKNSTDDYLKATILSKDFGNAYHKRGLCFLYLEQTDDACKDWNRAKDLGIVDAFFLINQECNKR